MSSSPTLEEQNLLDLALRNAGDTRSLTVEHGARHDAARVFASLFRAGPAVIVADETTFDVAGRNVLESFRREGLPTEEPFLFQSGVAAEYASVERLETALASGRATPIAVGSGTVNDLTKLAAHRLGRPYMVVGTAASMDGYTAFGASITHRGSKQTFACPAPRAAIADLEVIALAPRGMNASGYADLLAKGVAGADWILADALGEEPIDAAAWATVQDFLPAWVGSPTGIATADPDCLRSLIAGLMMSGFAMQGMRSSRPASGAEHQFSHLWDMQAHMHLGTPPSHGFKVAIGSLASLNLYAFLLNADMQAIDIETAVAQWPTLAQTETRIAALLGSGELASRAIEETRAKHPAPDKLRGQLLRMREVWPDVRERLNRHLLPFREAPRMLREAGCPTEPEQIGISRDRLRQSYEQAFYIRRRYTVLDFAMRAGVFPSAIEAIFQHGA